jgi:hypothetical protein
VAHSVHGLAVSPLEGPRRNARVGPSSHKQKELIEMIVLDQAAETTQSSPETSPTQRPASRDMFKGSHTVIILERDGSLRHYPPDRPSLDEHQHQARIQLLEEQAQPTIIDKILDFTFDVLGVSNLEVRVNEHPKR